MLKYVTLKVSTSELNVFFRNHERAQEEKCNVRQTFEGIRNCQRKSPQIS